MGYDALTPMRRLTYSCPDAMTLCRMMSETRMNDDDDRINCDGNLMADTDECVPQKVPVA